MVSASFCKTVLALTLTSGTLFAAPQIDAAKEADIRRLIELTRASKAAQTIMATTIEQMKPFLEKSLPEDPHKAEIISTFLERFQKRFNLEDLFNRIVPIYDRHLTHDDIKGLIQFYQTPLGQRVVQALPQIVQESQAVGAQMGQEIGQQTMMEVVQEIQAREKKE